MAASPADTIFAVSSGAAPAAIAVLRISGPQAIEAARAMAGKLPPPRQAGLRRLRADDGGLLDTALVLVFPGPDTATGEDLAELHLHGGRAIVAAVEGALTQRPGLRRAEPGEFTRRALANGRIDLAQTEGLADLLAAETEAQRRAAIDAVEGSVGRAVGGWTVRLVALSAQAEALIDFEDEDDVAADEAAIATLRRGLAVLGDEMTAVLANPPVERLRDGLRVVLAGPPNAGKSSLINALAERDVAITAPVAGTTRDRIEATVVRDGIAFRLTDTAGLAEASDDAIERAGIRLARDAIAEADLILWLGEEAPEVAGAIWVHARGDLSGREQLPAGREIAVSALTGYGIADLWSLLSRRAASLLPAVDRVALNRRQRSLVAEAAGAIEAGSRSADLLVVAEELRLARVSLGRIIGTTTTDDMLDALFGQFCIGK